MNTGIYITNIWIMGPWNNRLFSRFQFLFRSPTGLMDVVTLGYASSGDNGAVLTPDRTVTMVTWWEHVIGRNAIRARITGVTARLRREEGTNERAKHGSHPIRAPSIRRRREFVNSTELPEMRTPWNKRRAVSGICGPREMPMNKWKVILRAWFHFSHMKGRSCR